MIFVRDKGKGEQSEDGFNAICLQVSVLSYL